MTAESPLENPERDSAREHESAAPPGPIPFARKCAAYIDGAEGLPPQNRMEIMAFAWLHRQQQA